MSFSGQFIALVLTFKLATNKKHKKTN